MINNQFPNTIFLNKDTFDTYHIGLFYKDYILEKEYYPYQFDEWYDKKYYGRLDLQNNVIYPKKSFLKQHSFDNTQQKNISFVTDAFLDLKNFYDNAFKNLKINKNSIYSKINAFSSTEDAELLYINYIKNIYPLFENYFLAVNANDLPNSINSFMNKFIYFLDVYLKFGFLNRSSFLKSKNIPGAIDGLRISIDNVSGGIDYRNKANQYINNPQFDMFLRNSARFGFFIDKNKPWTIVFDLDSPVLKDYSSKYGLYSKDQILDVCYFKCYKADLENLNNLIVTFWNNYVNKNSVTINTLENTHCSKIYTEITNLQQLTQDTFNKVFNINWQLRFYLYVKIKEEKINIPQQKFEILHNDACKINKFYGQEESVKFINSKIIELSNRLKNPSYTLTSESEFYKLLEKQALSYKEELIKF